MEPISLTGPASYVAGGFTATFGNLAALVRAIVCLVSSATYYHFKITAKSSNQVTIKAFRNVNAHTHTFTGTTHTHSLTMNAHTHTFTGTAHGHTLTMNAHGHTLVATGNSTGVLTAGMSTTGFHIPVGNPTRTVAAGSASGVGNTTDTGTVANTTAAGTNANTVDTGTVGNTVAAGTNASTSADALEELGAGVNLSAVTLELLGFGT
jgi:hypothetical protein